MASISCAARVKTTTVAKTATAQQQLFDPIGIPSPNKHVSLASLFFLRLFFLTSNLVWSQLLPFSHKYRSKVAFIYPTNIIERLRFLSREWEEEKDVFPFSFFFSSLLVNAAVDRTNTVLV